jgi:TolB protein
VGGRIAFPAWDAQQGKYHTYIAQAKDGSERRLLIEGMHQPAFNPDGTWLAVNGEQPERMNLFILKEDGSNLKKVADFIEDGLPAWSPSGQGLVFSSTRHGDKQSRVYIIDEVPFDRGKASDRPLNFGPDDVRGAYPTWAPGDLIVYQGCDLTVEPGECGLYSISSFPGPQPATRLTEHADDTAPAASGDRVAFMSNRDGNWEVYIMGIDGSGVKRLTNDSAHDGLPTWSPDGKTIAFVSNRSGAWAIWAMNADGSGQRKLFDIGGGALAYEWQKERISWAP